MVAKKINRAKEIKIDIDSFQLEGFLNVPAAARGIVLFAHGSGSSRLSPRNQQVASFFHDANIATLIFDLLTLEEEKIDNKTRELRFNIPFLAERLIAVSEWIFNYPETHNLPCGYFGASTGSAAALIAAAELGSRVRALVSRGGRPDLAGQALSKVECPILLIVGADDYGVIELNQHSFDLLNCHKKLEIIPGATHLFEEPGALEHVARIATIWFSEYL